MPVMRTGRRRWAIENETFNTLKARDVYNFEHNYSHLSGIIHEPHDIPCWLLIPGQLGKTEFFATTV